MDNKIFFTTSTALKGRVKQRYSDFIVEEVLEDGSVCRVERYNKKYEERTEREPLIVPERKNEEHLILNMEKINSDTASAIALITRGINVSKKRIGYAGLKDKRAITCQRISIYMPDAGLVEKFGVRGIELRNARWSEKRVELGDLSGNQFAITIRNISENEEEIRKIIDSFTKQLEKGIPNFFGNQRFGGKRMITHKVGKLLLKGKFEEAVKLYLTDTYEEEKEDVKNARINLAKSWDYKKALKEFPPLDTRSERAMLNHLVVKPNDYSGAFQTLPKKIRYLFSHAVQSDLFNKILSERIKLLGERALDQIDGDILIEGVPTIILPGYESNYASQKAGEIEQKVLEAEGINFGDFKTGQMSELSSKGERKQMVLYLKDFKLIGIEKDEFNEGKNAAIISFTLSKGNYATTVLRELIKEEIF
ncbi:MAG: tRNA pseudouridine(13) synthase TruD [Candidatus Diapherotrites archaeon]|nr:tRNA pseudouridine(13) synthase TruD [Candidatus Diapherotrites archaeon]